MFKIWVSAVMAGSILCALEAATGPHVSALDRRIELLNATRMAIIEVYAAPVSTERWQKDLLGDEILPPANSVLVSLGDQTGSCSFDFKAIFDDGSSLIRRDINICVVERYAISYR
jgi:hypothetical protein